MTFSSGKGSCICGRRSMIYCGRCLKQKYCSGFCLSRDWILHNPTCVLRSTPPGCDNEEPEMNSYDQASGLSLDQNDESFHYSGRKPVFRKLESLSIDCFRHAYQSGRYNPLELKSIYLGPDQGADDPVVLIVKPEGCRDSKEFVNKTESNNLKIIPYVDQQSETLSIRTVTTREIGSDDELVVDWHSISADFLLPLVPKDH